MNNIVVLYFVERYFEGLGATLGVPLIAALIWGGVPRRAAWAVVISAGIMRLIPWYVCTYDYYTIGRACSLQYTEGVIVFVMITAPLAYWASRGVCALCRNPKSSDDR